MVFCNEARKKISEAKKGKVTILILIDGFLQCMNRGVIIVRIGESQSLF